MKPATGFQIAFLVFAFHFLVMLLANTAVRGFGWPDAMLNFTGQAISSSLAVLLFILVGPMRRFATAELRRPIPRSTVREVVLVAGAKVATVAALIGVVAAVALASGDAGAVRLGAFPVDPARAWHWTLSPAGIAQLVLLSWIAGPVIEELVFRGFLYRAWERQWGWIPSLLLTSACFGLCHPTHMASSFIGSVVYICVLRRTGTLRACIAVHALFNFLVSWPVLGQVFMQAPRGDPAAWSTWAPFLACFAFTAVALPAYVLMSRRDARDTRPA